MKINSPLFTIAARNGALAGVMAVTMLIILYVSGKHPFLVPVYADFRIFLFGIFIFFSLKEFRDRHHEGLLYFWQGMVGSYALVAVFSLITAVSIIVFAEVHPAFISDYIQLFTEQAQAGAAEVVEQMGKENFERNLEAIRATNGFERAFVYFVQSIWISLFVSIIVSVLLRKQPK
jgi:hypothetical protein